MKKTIKIKKSNKKDFKKNYSDLSLKEHKKFGGKLELVSKFKLQTADDLSIAYTPGVANVSSQIFKDITSGNNILANVLTLKKNTIAVVSDGSAVLGLGNIGPYAAIPVMEGKAVLMKHFANVDAFPICINTQDVDELVKTIKNIEPVFGGINLEDISAPRCFEIEKRLKKELNIPVMHDDQWGAATVTLAALINSLKVVKKNKKDISIVIVGAGAAGLATAKLISTFGVKNLTIFDSVGTIESGRVDLKEEKNKYKREFIEFNTLNIVGGLKENIHEFDVFIGLSKPALLTIDDVLKMSAAKKDPIIFALANPEPEIYPHLALIGGAKVVGTGRSDFPNQINNSIFFPGFWRGMLDRKTKAKIKISNELNLYIKCAEVIASSIKPTANKILPSTLDKKIHTTVANAVLKFK